MSHEARPLHRELVDVEPGTVRRGLAACGSMRHAPELRGVTGGLLRKNLIFLSPSLYWKLHLADR